MSKIRNLATLSTGVILGVALVISCSDDSPGDADAAEVCDCPAAEAPITSDRLVQKENVATLVPGATFVSQGVGCDEGGLLLTGGCIVQNDGLASDLVVTQSGIVSTGAWRCEWRNNSATETYQVKAQIKCLMPAE